MCCRVTVCFTRTLGVRAALPESVVCVVWRSACAGGTWPSSRFPGLNLSSGTFDPPPVSVSAPFVT